MHSVLLLINTKMKSNSILYFFTLVLWCLTLHQTYGQNTPQPVAHALGGIDGNVYTNSREAMINSIEKGYKFLEVDIDTTSDGVFVALHDWKGFNQITGHYSLRETLVTLEEFNQRKIYDVYTPITIQEIVDTLKSHPDLSLMTDKISDPDLIEKCFSEIKERVYVECFTDEDYFELKRRGYNVMCSTFYADNILTHIVDNLLTGNGRLDLITTSVNQDYKELKKIRCLMPIKIAIYTVNSEEDLNDIYDDIDFFYSDFYDPSTGSFNTSAK